MLNLRKSEYFNSLPEIVQESILQSGTKFKTEEDLRNFVSGLELGSPD